VQSRKETQKLKIQGKLQAIVTTLDYWQHYSLPFLLGLHVRAIRIMNDKWMNGRMVKLLL